MNIIEEYLESMPWKLVTALRVYNRKTQCEICNEIFNKHMGAPELLSKEYAIRVVLSSSKVKEYLNLEYDYINIKFMGGTFYFEDVAILYVQEHVDGTVLVELIAKSYGVID
jgi:hypothetical protein